MGVRKHKLTTAVVGFTVVGLSLAACGGSSSSSSASGGAGGSASGDAACAPYKAFGDLTGKQVSIYTGIVAPEDTAQIDSYLIEGHVPATDIRRLLRERPSVAGLAVPGMPPRTPGMAEAGTRTGGYAVIAFQLDGGTRIFARH